MPDSRLSRATEVFKAAGHPARLRILSMLRPGGLCVCQITAVLALAVSTVSAHLGELKRAGLVVERKDGRWVSYSLAEDPAVTALLGRVWALVGADPRVEADARLVRGLRRIPVEELCRVDLDFTRLGLRRQAVCQTGKEHLMNTPVVLEVRGPDAPAEAIPTPLLPVRDPPLSPGARQILIPLLAISAWWLVYSQLAAAAAWLTFEGLGLAPRTSLASAVEFFLYETPKVLMLLTLVVVGVGIVRSFFTPERTRRVLAGKHEASGSVLAALLGVVTPFCSCSAVPLFIGFVTTGVPLGVTFSFLVSAPMVNEIALALLFGLFGWKVAALYAGTGLAIAIVSGLVIGQLHLEGWVEPWVYGIPTTAAAGMTQEKLSWSDRVRLGREAVRDILGRVWPYVIGGIAVGAGIHGYVPQDFMASFMGRDAWWSVPLAVLIGIPLYSNAAGIIPIVQALLGKGAALGTVLAFMMSVIALSLPEMVILRKVLSKRLIAVFVAVVGTGILVVGYLFNFVL